MITVPKIVILGAGYGGIMTAIKLQKELGYNEANVTLVNKHDYHYMTTHLHMPAAGTGNADQARVSITRLIDEFKIDFVKSTVVQIKANERKIILEDGSLSFDYLVVALGGEAETFGIPGLQQHSLRIRSINSVRFIREHIRYQFARYKLEPERSDYLTFVVGGAGFTGIEFAGELADRIPKLCKQFDVDPKLVKLVLIEAGPTALPGFAPELADYAMKVLAHKGVTFKIGTAIRECRADGVVLADGETVKSATVIWTGGIRGNRLVEQAGFETVRGRVKVDAFLRAQEKEHVYVVGDCSLVTGPQDKPYPPTAQLAIQQGAACAFNLVAAIRGEAPREFKFSGKGVVASLGKGEAIGIVLGKTYKGGKAAVMKKLIDLRYLYAIGGIPLVLRKMRL
ncbi:NAD(P)/FAD-dependent oxidoreductase [Paenibacillus ginsengarvi]|uniref:NAD(P)/FAD-dependent oxidoreductase n=1 Tax=Paenibacillus ginsengarvi TaxID=400777 RepID=A0A3B0C5V4_9BACL|nr:NAD(P)/FAD-dependent oxidoreductase [Paenibacillus ginsengarvi]RKN80640.1 NAD(P)/FAD-dependent oxidoreductase [Paenibacillus ginsengarvi]